MSTGGSEVLILIPALNAATSLPAVLASVALTVPSASVIVVDDGSSDATSAIAAQLGVMVVHHSENRGKGAALQSGFDAALKVGHWNALVTMDADGQHAPEDLVHLIHEWHQSGADIVLGDRSIIGTKMPWARRLSNAITSFLVSARTGVRVPDSQCGYRLISRHVLELVRMRSTGFEAETGFLIAAARHGFRISSARVQTIYANEKSAMTHWVTTKAFIRVLLGHD